MYEMHKLPDGEEVPKIWEGEDDENPITSAKKASKK